MVRKSVTEWARKLFLYIDRRSSSKQKEREHDYEKDGYVAACILLLLTAAVAAWYVLQQVTRLRAQRVSPALEDFLIKCAKKY